MIGRRSGFDHYRLDGHEVVGMPSNTSEEIVAWAQAMEATDRKVAVTNLIDGSRVSTVFLGLNHSWGAGPPMLFETALFSSETHYCKFLHREVQECEVVARYATWGEAEAGHMEWVEKCVPPDLIAATAAHTP